MGNRKTRVVLASAQPDLLRLLGQAAGSEPGVTVVAEAGNTIEASALANSLRPDVVIVDAELPHVSTSKGVRLSQIGGLDAAIALSKDLPHSSTVVLSNWRGAHLGSNVELYLYRETLAGNSRIRFSDLHKDGASGNALVFAGLVATGSTSPSRKLLAASDKAIPFSMLSIIGGLALMLTVIGAAAGAVLAAAGVAALAVSVGVRAVAARRSKAQTGDIESKRLETEKVEAESHAVETRA